jgi:uncharacterized protein YegJ (DUF2314 family)
MAWKFIPILCLLMFACAPASTATTVPTTGADHELNTAIQQARDSLDKFIELISTPFADRTFVAVKVRFFPPDSLPQDIWVDNVTYTDGVFRGSMGDDIPSLKLELGKKITVEEKDIIDWMIVQDGKLIGGYTIRLAVKRMSPTERERFLQTLDYSIDD